MGSVSRVIAAATFVVSMLFCSVAARADTLASPYAQDNGLDGLFFDVVALNAVTITGLDTVIATAGAGGAVPYLIYGRPGTHDGFETSSAGWTVIGSGTSAVSTDPQTLLSGASIAIPAGQRYAFYVTTNGFYPENVRYAVSGGGVGGVLGHVIASDANIQILEGKGAQFSFSNTLYTGRSLVGSVAYSNGIGPAPVPTLSEWAMIILSLLLAVAAVVALQRRRPIAASVHRG